NSWAEIASMFCTNCGLRLTGNFCGGCGARAGQAGEGQNVLPLGDWRQEIRYAVLLYFPEVRDRLAAISSPAKKMTGEEWLKLYEKAFHPIPGVSVATLASIVAPISA